MRIIAGKYRGFKLNYKKEGSLRPTKDNVKESLFNMIDSYCENAVCLDLFAGTGSLGFEALSRNATYVDFVDIKCNILYSNNALFKDVLPLKIHKRSAFSFIKDANKKYDIIFIDPPWKMINSYSRALNAIYEFDIIKANGIIVLEHEKSVNLNELDYIYKEKKFGNTVIKILKKES